MSTTRTIRVDRDLLGTIQKLAKGEGVSANSLIGRLLKKYVEWDIAEEKTVGAHVSKSFLRQVMPLLTEEEVKSLAKTSASTAKTRIELQFGKLSLENFVRTVEVYSKYSGLYTMESRSHGGNDVINLRHEICYNWSLYLCTIIESLAREFPAYSLRTKCTSDSCVIEFASHPGSPSGV